MDFFKPKWKRKNPDKRMEWIKTCDPAVSENQKILEELARTDEEDRVSLSAAKKITDSAVLKSFVFSNLNYKILTESYFKLNEDDRISLIGNIEDKKVLKKIILKEDTKIIEKISHTREFESICEEMIEHEKDYSEKRELQKKYLTQIKDPAKLKEKIYQYNLTSDLLEQTIIKIPHKDVDETLISYCAKNLKFQFFDEDSRKALLSIGPALIPFLEDKIWMGSEDIPNLVKAVKVLDSELGDTIQSQLSKIDEDFLLNSELQILLKYWSTEAKKWWGTTSIYEAVCDWCGKRTLKKNNAYKKRSDLVCHTCITKGLNFSNLHNLRNYVGSDQYDNAMYFAGGDLSKHQGNSLSYSLFLFLKDPSDFSEGKLNRTIEKIKKHDWVVNLFAKFLMEIAYERSANIKTALLIAKEIDPSPFLLRQLKVLGSLPQKSYTKYDYNFTPELIGKTEISWSDSTFSFVKNTVKEILEIKSL